MCLSSIYLFINGISFLLIRQVHNFVFLCSFLEFYPTIERQTLYSIWALLVWLFDCCSIIKSFCGARVATSSSSNTWEYCVLVCAWSYTCALTVRLKLHGKSFAVFFLFHFHIFSSQHFKGFVVFPFFVLKLFILYIR